MTRRARDHGLRPVRLAFTDVLRLGLLGIRSRGPRAALSALGISLGIATLVLVTAVPASSRQALMNQLSALGTDMLRVAPQGDSDPPVVLPATADAMAARIGPVTHASAVANTHSTVLRSDRADPSDASGIGVLAARTDLLAAVHGTVRSGAFLSTTTARFPTVVLGSRAASRLGFDRVRPGREAGQVYIGGHWFTVIGILDPLPLAPDLDTTVLVGWDAARTQLDFDGHPTVVYVRAREAQIEAVRAVLPATVHPQLPGLVQVSRPSDALAAKRATQRTLSVLLLGLAGVALLVGGVGVANTMVVSVLERRREIGLRRALGASRGQIRGQFLAESVALSALGGCAGTALGAAAAAGYAMSQSWPVVVPPLALVAGVFGAIAVGVAAGLYPAVRASALPPTEALAAV
ncbi:ABC transporter permease [Streptomyces panaciradicis]|uniref:ABC transporter permease n=1 Tax=Streptomyces panaciradicis TaxID=1470261 RepID=UPI00201D05A3|nr:ABC transporter permease [Streptomyces panaciradicis]MCL6673748.1 ABC transporter permease [Streptomyces panaciradicis]